MNQTGTGTTAPTQSNPATDLSSVKSQASEAVGDARDAARSAIDDVKGKVSDGANAVLHGLSSAASDAKSHAADLAGQAKERVYGIVDEQKNVGADQIGGIADAVHSAADDLEERAPSVARYVHDAASGIERFSEGLRNQTVDDIVESVEHFARTQPLAFFGIAAVAGFAVSRFVKSSSDRRGRFAGAGDHRGRDAQTAGTRTDYAAGPAAGRGAGSGFDPKKI